MMSITAKLQEKLAARMEQDLGYRADLYIADFQQLTAGTAKVLMGFESHLGAPSQDDVRGFFGANFPGKVLAKLETARLYSDEAAVSIVAELYSPTRPMDDAQDMAVIVANARYLDTQMNETWEVMDGADDSKHLRRVYSENISEILQERRNRMTIKASNTNAKLTIASLMGPGLAHLGVGDMVKVMVDNKIVSNAEIVNINGAVVKVKCKAGVFDIPKEAVLEVQQMSPATKEKIAQKNAEYYSKAYGNPQYGKDLSVYK